MFYSFKEQVLLYWGFWKFSRDLPLLQVNQEHMKKFQVSSLTQCKCFSYFFTFFSQHSQSWGNTSSWQFLDCHFCNSKYANKTVFVVIFSLTNQKIGRSTSLFSTFNVSRKAKAWGFFSPFTTEWEYTTLWSRSIRLQSYTLQEEKKNCIFNQ